jgi:hypothetical protein
MASVRRAKRAKEEPTIYSKDQPEVYDVPSFTNPKITYRATPGGWCNCPRGENKGDCIKHPFLAAQLAFIGSWRHIRPTAQTKALLFSLVQAIFADTSKETPKESAHLIERCDQFQFSNRTLRKAARERHKRVISAHENKRKAA